MQQPTSLALLSAIYSFTLAAAGSLPRGVGPEFAQHYQNAESFTCITNSAIKLSLSQVNDNSCDCPDGSDEPGTAACAFIDPLSPQQPLPGSKSGTSNTSNVLPGFWCENKSHIGAYVPFVYVNDGVCDEELCCDGTEEFAHPGGVKCPNKCAEIGKEYRRLATEKKEKLERAGKKRKAMVKEAQDARKKVEDKVASLQKEIGELEARRDELKRKHEEVEREEKTRVVKGEGSTGGKLGVLVGVAKARVTELRNTLEGVIKQRDDLQSKVEELETILRKFKEEYNPNFNDEGVKAAVKGWEDYAAREESDAKDAIPDSEIKDILKEDSETSGVNWTEFEGDEGDDTDILYSIEAYLPGPLRSLVHDRINLIRIWLIENGILADSARAGHESNLVKAAREAAEAATKEHKNKVKSLDNEQSDLDRYYGPDDIFRALKGKCVNTDSGEYNYELCWLEKTHQKSKKGSGGKTNMGHFSAIQWWLADEEERLDGKSLGKGNRMVLRYENGQSCWNGPKRRTDVWLACAETEELWRISESEKCVYKMEVGTPAACDVEAPPQQAEAHDEL